MARTRLPGPTLAGQLRYLRAWAHHPYTTFAELHQRFGPVCAVGAGPLRYVWLAGREANELILSTMAGNFLWRDATALLIPVDGDTALVVSDGEDHRRRRRLVQPAFSRRRIASYLPIVTDEVGRMVDRWRPGATVDVHRELRAGIRRIVVRALFGPRLEQRADELGQHLEVAIRYVNRPPSRRFDHDLPGTGYRRAMRARRRADEVVFAEIRHRRAHTDGGEDVLAALLAAHDDETGGGLTDQEIRDQVISLIAAGYDTTSAGAAWAVHAAFSRPAVLARLRDEVRDVAGDGELTDHGLGSMPYLDAVVSETLRLWPPGPISGRKAVDDFEYAGVRIPGGSMVMFSPYLTHRLPELWPEPGRFVPERWIPGTGPYREPAPYSFIPFGGGYRRCIGFGLATMEIKAILAELARRVDLKLAPEPPGPTGIVTMAPDGGLPAEVLDVRRRPLARV